ncbi:MAG: hypothetical protein ABFD76_13825 [Smithella sp.]
MKRIELFSDKVESFGDKLAYSPHLNTVIWVLMGFVGGVLCGYFYHRQQITRLIELGF